MGVLVNSLLTRRLTLKVAFDKPVCGTLDKCDSVVLMAATVNFPLWVLEATHWFVPVVVVVAKVNKVSVAYIKHKEYFIVYCTTTPI